MSVFKHVHVVLFSCSAVWFITVAGSASADITTVTKGPADLVAPPSSATAGTMRYGLGFPFQVAPRKAALFCNLRLEGVPISDFENGTDVILFDDLSSISADGAIPISRNEKLMDSKTGKQHIIVKYPVVGGFVPLGAVRKDGSAHPHAGTGFGICAGLEFPTDENGLFTWNTKFTRHLEVQQYTYDGHTFRVLRSEMTKAGSLLPIADSTWRIVQNGLTNAIPDEDDMLQPVVANNGGADVSGVVRWKRRYGLWRPVSFVPITPAGESWVEASLIRDLDGSLLFSARGYGQEASNMIRVWRSADGGAGWELVIQVPQVRAQAPISLNRAADGTPYIAANLLGRWRETLCLWPLNADRSALHEPIVMRDAPAEFGPAPGGSKWMVDHPNAVTLRLADGKWHNVLVYRILVQAEHRGAAPPPQTGLYVEEVLSDGPTAPPWRFD